MCARPFARLKKKGSWLFGALLPFAENLLCFALFYLLNDRLGGGKYFAKLDFYLIYVLLFALLYGQHQAILSAFLASAVTLFVQLGESAGGKVAGSVSKATSFLINNDVTSTSGKNKKAQELGIPVISEDDFLARFGDAASIDALERHVLVRAGG